MDADRKERALGYMYGTAFVLGGIVLALVAHVFHTERGSIAHAVVFLSETLGIAFIALGIINVLIETKDWRNYFERRLQDIVIEQTFLTNLDKERLSALQVGVMKAFFKDPNIDREGSFLNYFHVHLHKFIAEPFREDVTTEVFLEEGAGDLWNVNVRTSYRCRIAGDAIQPQVRWWLEERDVEEVISVSLCVKYPENHAKASQVVELADTAKTPADRDALKQGISLEAYKAVDGLIVALDARYAMKRERLQYWTMAHPTKNFDITVAYPKDYDLQHKTMVVNDEQLHLTTRPGYLRAKCESWMLPGAGVAWILRRRADAARS
ncbi:MAG: hypothetical protein J0J01_05680 [Reyranella sp.]|nr:hypothetical protein [Reyranella sp.]MBN9086378.1 hypothetical protein [Reyranella sp.]